MKFNFPKEKLMLSKKQLSKLSEKQLEDLLIVLYSIEDTLDYKCKNVSDTINYIQRTYCKEVDYEG